ncbi:PHP domain-like protein [Hysterangium stoloniferum]|nr:PHP domain-like protein [Hysterangium stoloniferum]
MFFDLNVPLPVPALISSITHQSKKGKGKQKPDEPSTASDTVTQCLFSSSQLAAIEARIDILVHLGYTVLALNQIMETKIDGRTHVDWFPGLIPKLKKRQGVLLLKRLTIILDDDSDKGNGVNAQNAAILSNYDILSLRPTTTNSFSQACLTHSLPSQQTAHIISMPVTFPRLPFHLKHTQVRSALKNGSVFEIDYSGAVGAESERRNWWGGSRELVRVTKGKGILLSSGANDDRELRAPLDAANLVTLLGIPQNLSRDAIALTPKSVVLRAQSRKTYRSVLSEPRLIISPQVGATDNHSVVINEAENVPEIITSTPNNHPSGVPSASKASSIDPNTIILSKKGTPQPRNTQKNKKRPIDDDHIPGTSGERSQKKKKKGL